LGEIFITSNYLIYHGFINIGRGCFDDAKMIIEKLSEIANTYENDLAKSYKLQLTLKLMIVSRKFSDLNVEIEEGISFFKKIGLKQYINYYYTVKGQKQVLLNNLSGADESISMAKEYFSGVKDIPYYHAVFLLCQFAIDLCRLDEALKYGNEPDVTSNRKKAFTAGKNALRVTQKVACYQTEVLKLMGRYHWFIAKQKKAFKWWDKAIKKGEDLGARPDLSRTYFEVGKALLDPKCKYKEWNGMTAQQYFSKAKAMFQDMDLQYDLDELDKIAASN